LAGLDSFPAGGIGFLSCWRSELESVVTDVLPRIDAIETEVCEIQKSCVPPAVKSFPIFFKNLKGKNIILFVRSTERIEDVKDMIETSEEIPADQQRLLFAGKQLENGTTLEDDSIRSHDTIHVTLRMRG
jgi:ubiquitin C